MSEVIVFQGVKYRRYPEAKNWAERSYFLPGIADRQKGHRRLHEDLWIAAHGPIPPGCHIHHRDHNPLNNELSNLICITKDEHAEHHANDRRGEVGEQQRAHLANIRELAAEWHRSDEGRAWHSEHGARSWDRRIYVELECDHCEISYLTRSRKGSERFCSNACKSAARRARGVDDIDGICLICDAPFRTNRYKPKATCSRSCAMKLNHRNRRVPA